MTEISFEAVKDMTVGEVLKMQEQAKELPEGFKLTYKKEAQKAQDIIDELKEEE